jgi:hypothetical protein
MLNKITIDYPQTIPDCLQITREQFEIEAKMAIHKTNRY